MRRKKETSFLKRLFPHSPILRILFVVVCILTLWGLSRNAYHYYEIRQHEAELMEEKAMLERERAELEYKKQALQDEAQLEKKARDELGLVKPGEVPYVR